MINVHCLTNLDLRGETWPEELPTVPRVGDYIESGTVWTDGFQLTLEVVRVTWCRQRYYDHTTWEPIVELHDRKVMKRSIRQFYEWYAPLVGRRVSSFI